MNVLTMTRDRYEIYMKEVPSAMKRLALLDFVFVLEKDDTITILKDRKHGSNGANIPKAIWRNTYAEIIGCY